MAPVYSMAPAVPGLRSDLAAQFVVDMRANDLVERFLHLETEAERALGVEPGRPARDDLHDRGIRLAPHPRHHLVARDAAQRRDLLADRAGNSRHGEIDARPELLARQRRRVHQETD